MFSLINVFINCDNHQNDKKQSFVINLCGMILMNEFYFLRGLARKNAFYGIFNIFNFLVTESFSELYFIKTVQGRSPP